MNIGFAIFLILWTTMAIVLLMRLSNWLRTLEPSRLGRAEVGTIASAILSLPANTMLLAIWSEVLGFSSVSSELRSLFEMWQTQKTISVTATIVILVLFGIAACLGHEQANADSNQVALRLWSFLNLMFGLTMLGLSS